MHAYDFIRNQVPEHVNVYLWEQHLVYQIKVQDIYLLCLSFDIPEDLNLRIILFISDFFFGS